MFRHVALAWLGNQSRLLYRKLQNPALPKVVLIEYNAVILADSRSPVPPSSDLRAVLIYNPRSGTRDVQSHLPLALQVFREYGWRVEVQGTQRAGDVQRLAADAVRNNYQVVLTAGGDGSLNEAANALAHSEVALATLPTGTANVGQQIGCRLLPRSHAQPMQRDRSAPVSAARSIWVALTSAIFCCGPAPGWTLTSRPRSSRARRGSNAGESPATVCARCGMPLNIGARP
jgi:hypothetical protein